MAFEAKLIAVASAYEREALSRLWNSLDTEALKRDGRMVDMSETSGYRDYEAVLTIDEARAYLSARPNDRHAVGEWLDGLPAEAHYVVQLLEEVESGMGD